MYLKKVHFVLRELCLNFFNPFFCIKAPGFQKSPISLVTLQDNICVHSFKNIYWAPTVYQALF